jgi:hypothetical protein
MVQGICRILSTLPHQQAFQYVNALATPLLTSTHHQISVLLSSHHAASTLCKKRARENLKMLSVIIRTTRAVVVDGDIHQSEDLNHMEKRALELQVECYPVVQWLQDSWEALGQLLVPYYHGTGGSSGGGATIIYMDKKWCEEVCELLMFISVLPLRNSASLATSTVSLILPFVEVSPDAVLEFSKEVCEVKCLG